MNYQKIAYINAITFARTNELKAKTIFEFYKIVTKYKKEELRRLIIKVLANNLKKSTEKTLRKNLF